jgi:nitrate reductase gamma subunit
VIASFLPWWIWLAVALFVVGTAWRLIKYARAPQHVRWELYPVAHEPRRAHGGSYLEEKDWWTKPRKTSLIGEVGAMASEIFVLKGVWEFNRPVWWGSMPFHWGLYLMILATVGLAAAALGLLPTALWAPVAAVGAVGGALLAIGAAYLIVLRSSDRRLKPYTSPLDRINLLLLLVLGALSVATVVVTGAETVVGAVGSWLRLQPVEVPAVLAAQMFVAALFLLYMPYTRMIHFVSKYFTYHKVRWDDAPMTAGSPADRRLKEALAFGVSWSAEHVGGPTWLDVATSPPQKKTEGA